MEKGITKFNEKIHAISQNIKKRDKDKRKTKDDSCITSPPRRVIHGIDDPLLNGSVSDSATSKGRKQKHLKKSGYTSESGGESSSDHGGYMIHGRRWVIKE